jgi:hypothetical protein
MSIYDLTNITDVKLAALLVVNLIEIGEEHNSAILGVKLVARIKEVGFKEGKLKEDVCFFSAGMTEEEISDWISNSLDMSYSGLVSLIGMKVFNSFDSEIFELPVLDLRDKLTLVFYDETGEPVVTDQLSGDMPMSPFSNDEPYEWGIIASSTTGEDLYLTRSNTAGELDTEYFDDSL